jgi:hypothetical protein
MTCLHVMSCGCGELCKHVAVAGVMFYGAMLWFLVVHFLTCRGEYIAQLQLPTSATLWVDFYSYLGNFCSRDVK